MVQNKCLIFDADGVLFIGKPYFKELIERGLLTEAQTKVFFEEYFRSALIGKQDIKISLKKFLAKENIRQIDAHIILDEWYDFENILNVEVGEIIKDLSVSNIIILASNQESKRAEYIKSLEICGYFDLLYFSSDLGVTKDDPRFFSKIIRDLNTSPDNIHYWDDSYIPISCARKLNMNAYLYKNIKNLKEEIARIV